MQASPIEKTFSFLIIGILATFHISAQPDSITNLATTSVPLKSSPPQKNYLNAKSIIIPVAFINYGFSALGSEELKEINTHIRNEVKEDAPLFKTKLDNYLQYAPAASVYALNLAGVKGKHNFLDRSIIYIISELSSSLLVATLKTTTHQLRPDSSTYNSFPSGHTTEAFTGAEFLNQEFGWRSPWYSVAGYTVASGTAFLRIMNNRHWLSDVIARAGIGILTTKFSYWLYSTWEHRKRRNQPLLY